MSTKTKQIVVSRENWESLRKFGEFGESYNQIISKILARVDQMPNPKELED